MEPPERSQHVAFGDRFFTETAYQQIAIKMPAVVFDSMSLVLYTDQLGAGLKQSFSQLTLALFQPLYLRTHVGKLIYRVSIHSHGSYSTASGTKISVGWNRQPPGTRNDFEILVNSIETIVWEKT
jgi:hypothetical protein